MSVAVWDIALQYEDAELPFGELEFRGQVSAIAPQEALRQALDSVYERFDVPLAKCVAVQMSPAVQTYDRTPSVTGAELCTT